MPIWTLLLQFVISRSCVQVTLPAPKAAAVSISPLLFLAAVNNGSRDDRFAVYTGCQQEFPQLSTQWLNAEQGKSRAPNLAIYNSYQVL